MEISFTDYDFLKSNNNFKIIHEIPIYFDNKTFVYNENYMYWGLLNIHAQSQNVNRETKVITMSKNTRPVLFNNITGNFTFIGLQLKFANKKLQNFALIPSIEVNEFNIDFNADFNI